MQRNGALIGLPRVDDTVHRIAGIDGARMCWRQFHGVRRNEAAFSRGEILKFEMKVFDLEAADGGGHPTILVAMVVHGANLAGLPADGEEFVELGFIDEVARVVLAVPAEIGSEGGFLDGHLGEEGANRLGRLEGRRGQSAQARDKVLNWNPRRWGYGAHNVLGKLLSISELQKAEGRLKKWVVS